MIALDATPGGLRLTTPYDAAFLFEFKAAIPHAARAWQKPYWIVDPQYGEKVAELIQTYFGQCLSVPQTIQTTHEVRTITLHYLGRCKERGDGSAAYGTIDQGVTWSVIFPESILRAHFGTESARRDEPPTLYAVLGVAQDTDANGLKKAYRRMAMQWHPDHCKEPDATQRFQQLQRAYAVLREERTRKRYDAGLALERSVAGKKVDLQHLLDTYDGYRAPLRCGLILAEGLPKLGRFLISKIIAWEDLVDQQGRTLVASWDTVAEKVRMEWI